MYFKTHYPARIGYLRYGVNQFSRLDLRNNLEYSSSFLDTSSDVMIYDCQSVQTQWRRSVL